MKVSPFLRFLLNSLPVAVGLSFFATPANAELVDGLRNYWNFDDNLNDVAHSTFGSSSTVSDTGAFSTEAGSFGASQSAGFGMAIVTDGITGDDDTHVNVPNSVDLNFGTNDLLSISAWFQVGAFDTGWQALLAKGESDEYRIARSGESTNLAYAGGNAVAGTNSDLTLEDYDVSTGWHHVVAVTDNANGKTIYVDGVNVASSSTLADIVDDLATDFLIGANPEGDAGTHKREWNGEIDEVAMWERVLTAEEVALIYDEGLLGKPLSQVMFEQLPDADGDGLPDAWEIANLPAGAENDDGTADVNNGPAGDPDGDLLLNSQEYARNTDPLDDDTDDDMLKDGVESLTGIWDGVNETGTDPLNPDSDGDTLLDGVENPDLEFTGPTQTGSDPNIVDTDMDTFDDSIEVSANTDPNDVLDFPGATGLPIADDFEDASLDAIIWRVNTDISAGGASVIEADGHLTIQGRAHLYTRDQYDPVVEGGLYIKGQWTYNGGDDFLQILTRSDAIPTAAFGETQTGIEFFANQPGGIGIRARGAEVELVGNQSIGDISLRAATTYEFYVVDDGQGALGFCIWEVGDRGNAEGVQDSIASGSATSNHVVVHNREGGRSGQLEEIEIGALADTDGDGMPDFWEIDNGLNISVDDSGSSLDSDLLTNLQEYSLCLDPNDEDTDGDDLADHVESGTGTFVDASSTGTDPLDGDSDGDGLADGTENNSGTFMSATDPGTNPNLFDTDGDGTSDGSEVLNPRRDPLVADAPEGIASGLLAYWPFENDSLEDVAHSGGYSDSTVPDDGTFTGPATDVFFSQSGRFGDSSLELNGEAGWVTVQKSVDTVGNADTSSVAVSAWFRVDSFDTSWQALVAHGENNYWRIARAGDSENVAYRGGDDDPTSTSAFTPPSEWAHVVGMSDGTTSTLFINGVQEQTGNGALDTNLGGAPNLFIGANPQGGGREWEGAIDELAIWDRTLTQEEITALATSDASLEQLILGVPADDFRITDISFVEATGSVSITWNSKEGETYRIDYTTDLTGWGDNITDGLPAAAGQDETTHTFSRDDIFGAETAPRVFFRVQVDE